MSPFKKAASRPMSEPPLIRRYRFCATLQLRTPLRILELHGQEIPADGPAPIVEPLWHGTWTPVTATFRSLGIDIDELPPGEMAAEIGQGPADGGEFLQLLKRIRAVVEADGPDDVKRARLRSLLRVLPWPQLIDRLGGATNIVDRLLPR